MSEETGAGEAGAAEAEADTALGSEEASATALAGEAAPATETSAPETYEDFAVEGAEISAEHQESYKTWAKENGLSQEAASKAVAFHIARSQAQQKESGEAWGKQVSDWLGAAKADSEYGGESYGANIQVAVAAINKFGTPELKVALNEYGLGNHPELIRFAYRVGQAMKDDDVVQNGMGGGGGEAANTFEALADRIYS